VQCGDQRRPDDPGIQRSVPVAVASFCGVRAASQGGIEIGFHSDQALLMAAPKPLKGLRSLLLANHLHPEYEVDKVTTPRGCTISGLNSNGT